MKILHYFLGFPPYRSGGLTKFAYDLMISQLEKGNQVGALWPGKMNFVFDKYTRVKYRSKLNGIDSFEIINPLPVPLLDGINDIEKYTKSLQGSDYEKLLKTIKPDIIHIHTLMGLHSEFLDIANKLKIKTIFTTHDYFGICPKVNLLKGNLPCDNDHNCCDCVKCNVNALSIKKIKLLQSPMYRKFKELYLLKKMRQYYKNNYEKRKKKSVKTDISLTGEKYKSLRKYYMNMLRKIDVIHFNSTLSKKIYSRYIKVNDEFVMPITHRNIQDKRIIKKFEDKLRITYLGPTKVYKGFYLLLDVLDDLYDRNNFELNIYYSTQEKRDYLIAHDNYNPGDLEEIFKKTDILVAPSIWYETFGFTVLEAISYGVPAIISENVGAKDVVGKAAIIVNANDYIDLKDKISFCIHNYEKLTQMNKETFNCVLPDIGIFINGLEDNNEQS